MDDRRDGWVLESLGQLLAEGIATEIRDYSGHLAHSYDHTHGHKQDDLALYLELAGAPGRRILELGAGTGRVALALAAAGHDVVALDSSRDMLAVLRQKAAAACLANVEPVLGDMAHFELGRGRFDLIVCAFNSFAHLEGSARRRACVEQAAAHLGVGGQLVLDVELAPGYLHFARPETPQVVIVPDGTGGHLLQLWFQVFDRVGHAKRSSFLTVRLGPDGGYAATVAGSIEQYVTRAEVELLLEASGLEVERCQTAYPGAAQPGTEERLVVVARRRQ